MDEQVRISQEWPTTEKNNSEELEEWKPKEL